MSDAPLDQEPEETTLQALREALTASQQAMRLLQDNNDQAGAIKAARAVSDIGGRIAGLESKSEVVDPARGLKQRREFLEALVTILSEGSDQKRSISAGHFRREVAKLPEVQQKPPDFLKPIRDPK